MPDIQSTDFSIDATGNIRQTGATTVFDVLDLHSWIQNLADNDGFTGDDLLDITSPNPSRLDGPRDTLVASRLNLLSSGSVSFNIDSTASQYFKFGSIKQDNGNTQYSGLKTIGSIVAGSPIYVIQNNAKLTKFWSSGHIQILILVRSGGSLIANGDVTVFSRKYGQSYSHFDANLSGGGESSAAISTAIDTAVTLTEVQAAALASKVTLTVGDTTQDLSNGNGPKLYKGTIALSGGCTLQEAYQYLQYITREDSTTTINGEPGWRYRKLNSGYSENVAAPFGSFAGGTFFVAQGWFLSGVLEAESGKYQLIDHDATTQAPLQIVALKAPNFANGTRAYAARVQTFTVASTAINTTTDIITLGNDNQNNAAAFATAAPWTQVRFSLASGATLPATTGNVLKDGGFYYWSGGKLYTSIANIPATPIDFTSQGSGNFTIQAETELFNTTVSGGSGLSQVLSEPTGRLIRLKAAYWASVAGTASAGAFFDNRDNLIAWSSTGGVSLGATVGPSNLEAVHEAIVATAQIQSNKYGLLSPADSGDTLTQFSIALEGIGTLQINSNDPDGVELIQNIFLWWCWIRSTQDGIRLASYDTLQAINFTSYQAGRVEVENTNSALPLSLAGGSVTFPGISSGIAQGSFAINLNADVFGTGATVTTGGISPSATDIRNAVGLTAPNLDNQLTGINTKTSVLPASFPANFSDLAITASTGRVTSASVQGNVTGSVGSVTNPVTVGSNNDKNGYSLITPPPTAAQNASQVRTELNTELSRIDTSISSRSTLTAAQIRTELATELTRLDVAVSSRLAASGYTTPPTTAQIATAVEAALLNDTDGQALLAAIQAAVQALFDQQADIPVATLVSLIAAQITADHGSGSYTTANTAALALEASVQAIKTKTDNLPPDPADQSELVTLINTRASQSSVNAIPTTPAPTAAQNAAATWTYATGDRALTGTQATEIAKIQGIRDKTDNLPTDPADQSLLIDAINTRLAASSYTAPPSSSDIAQAVETILLSTAPGDLLEAISNAVQGLFNQGTDVPVATLVSLIANQITTDHGAGSYVAPNISALALEASVQAVKTKTDNLPSDPADQSLLIDAINTRASQASVDTKASQSSVDTVQAGVNAIPTTPLLAANYTAPDNAGIAAIKAKTDNLPSDPADQSLIESAISALPSAATIADTVWAEPLVGYTTEGTAGKKLADTATPTNIPPGLSAQQVWEYPTRQLTGTQASNLAAIPNIPTNPLLASAYTPPPTAATIADAVWDETLSQHLGVGSTGAKLSLASTLTVGDIPAGLTAAQVWNYTGGDRSLSGAQAVNSAVTLGLIQAFVQGRFRINYSLGKAYQYGTDGTTVLQEFNLRDADGNPANNAQTAVDRVPVGEGSVAPVGLFSLGDLADVNLNPVDGSVAVWDDGELTITPDVQRSNIIGGGNF